MKSILRKIRDWDFKRAKRIILEQDRDYRNLVEFRVKELGGLSKLLTHTLRGYRIEFKLVEDKEAGYGTKLAEAFNDPNPILERIRKSKG